MVGVPVVVPEEVVLRMVLAKVSGSAGVAAGVPVVAPGGVVLRMASARVSDSAWSCRIDFVSGGTMQAYGLLRVSLSVVQLVVLGWRWFGFYSVSDRRTFSGYRGYPRFVLIIS